MDAPEEDLDIKLQKVSGDFISDFDRSLPVLLRKQDGSLRMRVRTRETYRLANLVLGPFQELPQLLDPHLSEWLTILARAYLEHLQVHRAYTRPLSLRNNLLMPLNKALAALLYTLCKIRGEKVIVRFLNVEARYLEPLLAALEDAERVASVESQAESAPSGQWTWEQRYIVLLWLSHLMLAPFDLATISSAGVEEDEIPAVPGFRWPEGLPGITVRVLPVALKYLATPGKERDAAKALLVRISMRKDMQQLGVLDALVQWALYTLRPRQDDSEQSPYRAIGVLSYLAGILASSSDTSDMDKYLTSIFHIVHGIACADDSESTTVSSSALARKMSIKVIRSIAVLILRSPQQDMDGTELVETTIGYLLESLADNDTPVRLAASKALSIITLKLEADMASQVVEAVLEALNRNVLRVRNDTDPEAASNRDLSAVDPLEWHGLMLTLAHLLYRRSPPADNLSDIVQALILGLSFEQRSASGGSVGTNVRDAACFGIWALARRYTTSELLAVSTSEFPVVSIHHTTASVQQILATELIVAACLDPAGNNRRGSSAALQELTGRHPDTVEQGIWVVQTVDYHAVARRSRAVQDVALAAADLNSQYGEAALHALLGWRGVGNSDAAARRSAAIAYGTIAARLAQSSEDPLKRLHESITLILARVHALQQREVDELHGLLLSFAAVLDALPAIVGSGVQRGSPAANSTMGTLAELVVDGLSGILNNCKTISYRRQELVTEAACRLIISSFSVLQAAILNADAENKPISGDVALVPGPSLISNINSQHVSYIVSTLDAARAYSPRQPLGVIELIRANVCGWLTRQELEVISAVSEASLILLILCDATERKEAVWEWADTVRHRPSSRVGTVGGYFAALTMSYPVVSTFAPSDEDAARVLSDAVLTRWAGDKDTETRVSILQSLTQSSLLREKPGIFLDLIAEGLDDYTTNARGDVGSHVRLEAIRAVKSLWSALDSASPEDATLQAVVSKVFLRILRLAAEKLDRVRSEAHSALQLSLNSDYARKLSKSTFSSKVYFLFLLNLLTHDRLHPSLSAAAKASPQSWMEELLAGFVSSADTGNEDLVIASRAALCEFCGKLPANLGAVCTALVRNLKAHQGNDRVLVPTLETTAFLFHVGLFGQCEDSRLDYRALCLQVQKACYKTGSVRKLEACVKVYGAIAAVEEEPGDGVKAQRRPEGVLEARKRLGAVMFHPWPRIRTAVVDELWALMSGGDGDAGRSKLGGEEPVAAAAANALLGVDWGKAEKGTVKAVVEELGLS